MLYEIHQTLNHYGINNTSDFMKHCEANGIKVIHVIGDGLYDIMTSHMLVNEEFFIAFMMNEANKVPHVVRTKVEIPFFEYMMAKNMNVIYFEVHIEVDSKRLGIFLDSFPLKATYTSSRKDKPQQSMVTFRSRDCSEFQAAMREIVKYTSSLHYKVKMQAEACIFDSNEKHDDPWIKNNG